MEIVLPWSSLIAWRVARYYGVPTATAFHQVFCNDPNHFKCF